MTTARQIAADVLHRSRSREGFVAELIDDAASAASVTPQDRRFAQDLVLAVAGYPQEAPALVTFAPMRATGDETAAFARGQIDRRRAECAVVSRSVAAALALPVDDAVEIGVTKLNGARCFVVAEIAALRPNPDAKRNLWRALSQHP